MKCNCLNGKIGRPDLPEGEETCWQCKGTGVRRRLIVHGFGAASEPEGRHLLSDGTVEGHPFFKALREHMERNNVWQVDLRYADGGTRFELEDVKGSKQ